ncbi:hypothetical protein BC939DRAFT_520383, partial [Gamsiella multidivaricata]|uniref:uncharacterized protein n=1 Tax=Gamsiella multidivaricata TaxID=101098 RepID=UPI00221EBA54
SHEIYEAFIGDLNAATTYELGLSGTTDAILDLGELGQIEIQGINLDVKTPLDGLQGLKVIEFLNPLGMGSGEHNGIPTIDMTVLVNIHNPSKLTLNIGNLVLNGGVNYTEEGYLGTTSINNLQLVPGDNRYVSLASLSVLSPNMEDFLMSVLMSGNVSTLYLQGFSDSSSNPALSAGLKDLRSEIGIPPNFKVPNAGYPYLNNTVKIKVLPTTVDDGLVEMSMDFRSMYYGATVHFDDAVVDRDRFEAPFSNVALAATTGAPVPVFAFMSNFQFSVGGNDIKTVTFKVNFTDAIEPSNPLSRDKLVGMVERSKSGYVNSSIDLYPTIHFNNDPTQMNVDWTSGTYFPETGGIIPIQTGPDFALLLNWWDKNHPEAAAILDPVSSVTTTVAATSPATVSPLPVATTTASNPTQTTAAPSFTPSPSTAPITP